MDLIRGGFSVRRVLLLAGLAFVAFAWAGSPNASAAEFPQCPAVGDNDGCAILIVINANGSVSILAAAAPNNVPYDGADDTLIGLQNNSASSISSIDLSSATVPIFGFDGDGICDPNSWPNGGGTFGAPAACPSTAGFGPTGYEGPGTSFSNISGDEMSGRVNFSPAVGGVASACGAPVASAYFALEEELSAADINFQAATACPAAPPAAPAAAAPAAAKKTCKKGSKLKGGKCVKKKKKKKKKVKPTFTG